MSWNLPDGCSDADIDAYMGDPDECADCGVSGGCDCEPDE